MINYANLGLLLFILIGLILMNATDNNLSAQSKKIITPEEMWKIKRVSNPAVSPDGNLIAFQVTEWDIKTNTPSTNLYRYNLINGELRQFTQGNSDNSPVWSPDGKFLAFLSKRDGNTTQLYVMPIDGGEAKKITKLPVGVSSPRWFPDGKKIAFVANILPEYDGDFEELDKLLKEKKESKMSAKATENRIYRYWDRWLTDGMYPRLFSVELETEKVVDLMPGINKYFSLFGSPDYDISPDGKQIAVSVNSTEPPYDDLNYDIYLLLTDGSGKIVNITSDNIGSDFNPRFSQDGKRLLYGRQLRPDFYADNVKPIIYDLASRKITEVAPNLDLSFEELQWSNDGNSIYFHAEDKAVRSLFSIQINGAILKEILRGGNTGSAKIASNNRLVLVNDNLTNPPEIFTIDNNGKNLKQLTFFNKELISGIKFGKVENVTYKGANDVDIQMYVVYPPDFDEKKKYPLMLMIHGGPHGIFGDAFHFRWNAQLFASPGYIVAFPNFHGSTSFGLDFALSIHGEHPTKPFIDVMKATDYLIARGFIDEKRMSAAGGSYGGYLVCWIAGHTDRYACLINHAGVYNLMQQFGSDITTYRDKAYGGTPWDGLEIMQKWNPAVYAKNFVTPMLIIHGEKDYRVPANHALEVYGIYKGKGVDARLVYYPDENHWILTPQNSIYWYKEVYDWLDRYLKK